MISSTVLKPHALSSGRAILEEQRERYESDFYRRSRWRWTFRPDCRYRWHRLREVLLELGFAASRRSVLEIGFGSGDLLFRFPSSCRLMGIELSRAAVDAALADPRLRQYRQHWFETLTTEDALPAPPWPADLLLASHVLEHVPDDRALLEQTLPMLRPGGLLVAFVPLEVPGFDPKHVRCYSAESLGALVEETGHQILHLEVDYHIGGGPLRWLDHPARHEWPVLTSLEGIRNLLLTSIPYGTARAIEDLLVQVGAAGTQAMVVAQKPGA